MCVCLNVISMYLTFVCTNMQCAIFRGAHKCCDDEGNDGRPNRIFDGGFLCYCVFFVCVVFHGVDKWGK